MTEGSALECMLLRALELIEFCVSFIMLRLIELRSSVRLNWLSMKFLSSTSRMLIFALRAL